MRIKERKSRGRRKLYGAIGEKGLFLCLVSCGGGIRIQHRNFIIGRGGKSYFFPLFFFAIIEQLKSLDFYSGRAFFVEHAISRLLRV